MAHEHFDIEPEDDALREAVLALLRAVDAPNPDPDVVAAARDRVRQTLGQNDYPLVNGDAASGGSLHPETPADLPPSRLAAPLQTASPETAATWPPMTINHGKVDSSRLHRSKTIRKVILVSLLWNQDREVDKEDLLEAFRVQRLEIRPETLLSRISKMRSDRLIARRDTDAGESLGVYRLTEAGLDAARIAAVQLNAVPPQNDHR